MRGALAVLLIAAFGYALYVLFDAVIPKENEQLLTYMLGQLSGMVTMALGFWFTTSQSSHRKDEIIATMAGQTEQATGKPDDPVNVAPAPRTEDL